MEAYKRYITPIIDDYWQVTLYKKHLKDMERWQQCCPSEEQTARDLNPKKAIPESIGSIELPEIFARESPCGWHIHEWSSDGQTWLRDFTDKRRDVWEAFYTRVNAELHSCCVRQFNACLAAAAQQGDNNGLPTGSEASRCREEFSPEQQQVTTTDTRETQPSSAKQGQTTRDDATAVLSRLIQKNKVADQEQQQQEQQLPRHRLRIFRHMCPESTSTTPWGVFIYTWLP